jgi:hypothetical protein
VDTHSPNTTEVTLYTTCRANAEEEEEEEEEEEDEEED